MAASFRASLGTASWLSVVFDQHHSIWRSVTNQSLGCAPTDPLQYFLRLHDERSAQSRLDDVLGSETRNAVAKHELIEIIRTTKDRVPLRDTLLTGAGPEQDMGSLVPIQKGRKLVEQQIFAEAAQK